MRKPYFLLCFLLLIPAFLSAQTAAELDEVLDTREISYSHAARFVIASANVTLEADAAVPETAFELAMMKGWVPKKASPDDPITLGGLSFLIMKAFNMKGGLMYLIMPGPRYAFRAMVSRSLIQGSADPSMKVSGDRFLLILGNVLNTEGAE